MKYSVKEQRENDQKEKDRGEFWSRLLFTGVLALLVVFTAVTSVKAVREYQLQQGIAEKILRFHVRANSDSQEDQDLKLKVRDAVGALLGEELAQAEDLEESKRIIEQHQNDIIHTAEAVLEQEGYDYAVEAYLAEVDFPVKTYGSYTFPAGTYEALEIVIGAGAGHNWWCVMYPNMCFADSVYEVVDEESKEALEGTLSKKEYESLMEEKNYRISWKWLDFLEDIF
ncbi:MAG: stage II sporulation protein R [Lachnospiraceae bacterium]|nr:stage II sporulation protein R [Lachnospiraceae bacterium]MDE7435054.1 stage II sporulation protein R [Lachnospiraceae bacterium]